jgi:opacity protein-like surface antigen
MMGFRLIGCAGAAALMLVATAAHAVCEYRGVMGAQSTIAQEFEDSQWVVRVAVFGGDYHWSDEGESWTTYRLKVLQSYKGQSPAQITLFTMRDSGGFYLDGDNATPDLDHEYLLFLNPLALDRPPRDARQVNYSCGKSGRWDVVPAADRAELARLSSSPR